METTDKQRVVDAVAAVQNGTSKAEPIVLRVQPADGGPNVQFKISPTAPLSKLMNAYAQRQGMNPATLRFMHNGVRLHADETASSLDMESDDVIDAMVEQTGGGAICI